MIGELGLRSSEKVPRACLQEKHVASVVRDDMASAEVIDESLTICAHMAISIQQLEMMASGRLVRDF